MRFIHFLFLLGLSVSSTSHAMTKLVCREVEGPRLTVVLELSADNQTPLTQAGYLKEGEPYLFRMDIYTTDNAFPERSIEGTVETSDVMFSFNNEDEKVGFRTYLDELDQSQILTEDLGEVPLVCY